MRDPHVHTVSFLKAVRRMEVVVSSDESVKQFAVPLPMGGRRVPSFLGCIPYLQIMGLGYR